MLLNESQIIQRLKQPRNKTSLNKALLKESEYKQFFYNHSPELIFNKVKGFNIAAKQFTRFKNVFENHPQSIINTVVTHYKKVFSAHGRHHNFSFSNINVETNYKEDRKTLFNGISGFDWWEQYGHIYSFTEPSSVLLSLNGLKVKHFPVEHIHDIEVDESGVKLLILQEQIKEGKEDYIRYIIYDELFTYIFRTSKSKEGFEPESIQTTDGVVNWKSLHGAKKCPATQIVKTNADINNFIVKKSLLDDSIKDLYAYSIFKTFYQSYKARGSFGTRIKAKLRCDFKNNSENTKLGAAALLAIKSSEVPVVLMASSKITVPPPDLDLTKKPCPGAILSVVFKAFQMVKLLPLESSAS